MSNRNEHDDFELASEYDFSDGIRGRFFHPKKKASEKKIGYQSPVNAALREYVHDHSVE